MKACVIKKTQLVQLGRDSKPCLRQGEEDGEESRAAQHRQP